MDSQKKVLWIDQNNEEKEENKEYLKIYSEELKNFSFKLVNSVEKGYSYLSQIKSFELIYVILSGRLAENFLDSYEENLRNLSLLTANIIFCFNGQYHNSKKYANDPFYNPGGVVTQFEDVIKFLKKDISRGFNKPIIKDKYKIISDKDKEKSFIIIQKNIENISLPIILKKFASRFINEEELEKLKEFLIYNYFDAVKESGLLDIFRSKIKIPYYLYSKMFIRLFTMESKFYKELNKSLINGYFSDFNQYIFILYSGLNRKVIKDYNGYLYRASIMYKQELYNIKNSCKLVLAQSFLSFSKDDNLVLHFMQPHHKSNSNLTNILFIVNPLKEKDITVTNMDIEKISVFVNEREVLFLPFSGFEIVKIEEETEYTKIYLNYLNKYEKKAMDYIDARSKDRVEHFLKEIKESLSNIFKDFNSDKFIQFIDDYQNKKNVLWIDQYSRCKVYDNYLQKYSNNLKDFYFEKATTITEAFSILSNYEFKMIYIIINDKLSEQFFLYI